MSTLFPAALDIFTNPGGTEVLGGSTPRTHSQQHADLNDAVEAIEALIGLKGTLDIASVEQRLSEVIFAASSPDILRQQFLLNRGGPIGISATKGAVALRFDDWTEDFGTTMVPELASRGLPASLALISNLASHPWGDTTTWAQIKDWCFNHGVEIAVHGYDHNDYIGYAGLVANIIGAKTTIEAQDIPVTGFALPGVTEIYTAEQRGNTRPYNGLTSIADYDSIEGRLIQRVYAYSQAYVSGSILPIPNCMWHGSGHYTLNLGTLVTAKALVDECYLRKMAVRFMVHAGEIGKAGNMTLADLLSFLDYVVTKRDADLIEVVAPSSFPVLDRGSTRLDLLTAGDFLTVSAANKLRWNNIDDGTNNVVYQTGGPSGGPYLKVISSGPNQRPDRLDTLGLAGGTYVLSGLVSSAGPGTTSARMIIQSYPTADSLNINWIKTGVATGSWQRFYIPFTIPLKSAGAGVQTVMIFPHKQAGDPTLWANLKCLRV